MSSNAPWLHSPYLLKDTQGFPLPIYCEKCPPLRFVTGSCGRFIFSFSRIIHRDFQCLDKFAVLPTANDSFFSHIPPVLVIICFADLWHSDWDMMNFHTCLDLCFPIANNDEHFKRHFLTIFFLLKILSSKAHFWMGQLFWLLVFEVPIFWCIPTIRWIVDKDFLTFCGILPHPVDWFCFCLFVCF